jgi:hypothetical protein
MFKAIKEFFFGKPQTALEAPYKVETPAAVEVAVPVAETKPAQKPVANVAAKKIAAVKKPAAKKPAAPKAK